MKEDFVKDALKIIRSTRDLSFPSWGKADVEAEKSNAPGDMVTKLDLAIEEYLTKHLSALDSGIGFVGEEFGGDRAAKRFWLCDPIDGTGCYIRGLPFSTTMIALIEDGRPTFSAIYDFVSDTMYHAVEGGGAYKNGEAIRMKDRPLQGSYLFHESRIDKPENMDAYMALRKKSALFKTMSAGYEFSMCASGQMDGRIAKDPYGKDYDFAPGALLVKEAGGIVANLGKTTYDYRDTSFIAASPKLYEELTTGPDAIFPITP